MLLSQIWLMVILVVVVSFLADEKDQSAALHWTFKKMKIYFFKAWVPFIFYLIGQSIMINIQVYISKMYSSWCKNINSGVYRRVGAGFILLRISLTPLDLSSNVQNSVNKIFNYRCRLWIHTPFITSMMNTLLKLVIWKCSWCIGLMNHCFF